MKSEEFEEYLKDLPAEEQFQQLKQFIINMMDWTEQSRAEDIYIEIYNVMQTQEKIDPFLEDELALHIWRLIQLHPEKLKSFNYSNDELLAMDVQNKRNIIRTFNQILGIQERNRNER